MANQFIRLFTWILLLGIVFLAFAIIGLNRNQLKSFKLFHLMAIHQYDHLPNTTNSPQGKLSSTNIKEEPTQPPTNKDKDPILILYWSSYFGSPVVCDKPIGRSKICNNTNLNHCKIPCEITANRNRADNASVMIVSARDPNQFPPAKYNHLPLVLFSWENPVYTPTLNNPTFLAHFNYLMSYRADVADFFLPSMDRPSVEPKPIPFAQKTGLVAAVFSNCETARTAYLKELMKHINVDSYGACLRNKNQLQARYIGDFKQAKIKILRNYKFTIVFHNQDCDYFVDDQLTHALDAGTIPVYMGTDKVHELLGGNLKNSIIKVRNFTTPKKLAKYLLMVSKNESLYNEHLKWKYEGFQYPQSFLETPQGRAWTWEKHPDYCDLCQTMADIKANKQKMKKRGLIKRDYCRLRKLEDWWIRDANITAA